MAAPQKQARQRHQGKLQHPRHSLDNFSLALYLRREAKVMALLPTKLRRRWDRKYLPRGY